MPTRAASTRRVLAGTTLAIASAALLVGTTPTWNHDPASLDGPGDWGRLAHVFATCGAIFEDGDPFAEVGLRQSPIDIDTVAALPARVPPPRFRYLPLEGEVENTGHVVEVPYDNGSTLRFGGVEYELLQFHFHARSEHTIDGGSAALEVHLVHRNVLGDLAVVGVLMQVGRDPNRLVDVIFEHAPLHEGHEALPGAIDARELLPPSLDRFYVYSGSLTTPPCSEGVRWIVMAEPVVVSQAAVDRMMTINAVNNGTGYEFNHRPVRPLNRRAVLVRTGGDDQEDD